MKEFKSSSIRGAGFLLLTALAAGVTLATGNIDPTLKFAWSEGGGWMNWNSTHGGVTVEDGYLHGHAWAENIGWVKLGAGKGPYANTDAGNYGVNMDAQGRLSGYAWSEGCGWIGFSNSHGQVTCTAKSFDGYAWSENVGWVHFKNTSPAYNVKYVIRGTVIVIR